MRKAAARQRREYELRPRRGPAQSSVFRDSARWCGGFAAGRALLVLALGAIGTAAHLPAQSLGINPRELATATSTARAGEQTLDGQPRPDSIRAHERLDPSCARPDPDDEEPRGCSIDHSVFPDLSVPLVYVPPQCVGAHRCPLLFMYNTPKIHYQRIAEKYGIITVGVTTAADTTQRELFKAQFQQLLQTFAIDPDKIAITRICGCPPPERDPLDPNVFSLVVSGMPFVEINGRLPGTRYVDDDAAGTLSEPTPALRATPATWPGRPLQYLVPVGVLEMLPDVWRMQLLRDLGVPVTFFIEFRPHEHTYEKYDLFGWWLQQRWAVPDPAARPATTFRELPLLTTDAMTRLTTFWTQFMQLPDSIRRIARRTLLREVRASVGKQPISVWMTDMPALAARYPAVAAALRAAQLTAEEHEAYRVAIAGTIFYHGGVFRDADGQPTDGALNSAYSYHGIHPDTTNAYLFGVTPTSVMGKNAAFLAAHPHELQALMDTKMLRTP